MKKYARRDQIILAICAADWAARVLRFVEQARPGDAAPRQALAACRKWARTGLFKMAEIRHASLNAHAVARRLPAGSAAALAAHAAGQAVATAHVPQHAWGAAYYALRAIAAANSDSAEPAVAREYLWQSQRLPPSLRREYLRRLTVHAKGMQVFVKLHKGEDF